MSYNEKHVIVSTSNILHLNASMINDYCWSSIVSLFLPREMVHEQPHLPMDSSFDQQSRQKTIMRYI